MRMTQEVSQLGYKRERCNTLPVTEAYSFESLYDSMMKCKKGVLWKNSVASFFLNDIERLIKLARSIDAGTYKPRKPFRFEIHHPKKREIASISFKDRIPQRSLNDNIVYPIMTRSFIHDNYACQIGKGTDKARDRLKEFLHRHYRKHGINGYIAQFDIKGFYPNMDHEIVEEMFRKKLPDDAYIEVKRILDDQYDGSKGYNPGSQLVQIAGISILDGMDHYIKENLHAKLYLRYMDDFLIISHNKEYLAECVENIKRYLAKLKFEINDKKTRIFPLTKTIEFLGFDYRLTSTGKVVMNARSSNVKSQRKKLRRMALKAQKGEIERAYADASFEAWKPFLRKGNSHKLIQRMNKFYESLWKGEHQ